MKILITGAASRLGQAVAEALEGHTLRLVDESPVEAPAATGSETPRESPGDAAQGSLLDQDFAWRAVRGMDAVVHTGEPPQDLPESDVEREKHLLELATRGTHQLFKAGVEAGVKRFVYGGTLDLFRPYPDDVYISELWKPLPEPDMPAMSRYLGEHTAREFARDHMVTVTGLRLGTPGQRRGGGRPGTRPAVAGLPGRGPGLPPRPGARRLGPGLVDQPVRRVPHLRRPGESEVPHQPGPHTRLRAGPQLRRELAGITGRHDVQS